MKGNQLMTRHAGKLAKSLSSTVVDLVEGKCRAIVIGGLYIEENQSMTHLVG